MIVNFKLNCVKTMFPYKRYLDTLLDVITTKVEMTTTCAFQVASEMLMKMTKVGKNIFHSSQF